MNSRILLASILAVCLVALGFIGFAPVANAAPAGQSLLNSNVNASNAVTEVKYRRKRGRRFYKPVAPRYGRFYAPIAPSYLAYDYPYYYSRGYYPTHIGPGYVYYGYPYFYHHRRAYYPGYGVRRAYRHRGVRYWGF